MQTTQNPDPASNATGTASKNGEKRQAKRRMARPPADSHDPALPPSDATSAAPTPRTGSNTATVIALLSRDEGATLTELVKATDWLPHTIRAALTGLRKKGHAIERTKRDGMTCYRIAAAAPDGANPA